MDGCLYLRILHDEINYDIIVYIGVEIISYRVTWKKDHLSNWNTELYNDIGILCIVYFFLKYMYIYLIHVNKQYVSQCSKSFKIQIDSGSSKLKPSFII